MSDLSSPRARLCLLAAALLFATGGPAIKACELSGWQIACGRSGIAALTLLLFARPSRASFTWKAVAVGIAHGATMVLFAAANKLTTATNAIFLQDASILFVLLLAPWLLREKLRRHDGLVLVLVAVGMAFLVSADQSAGRTAPDPARGNLLAMASSVTWAFTVIGMRWLAAANARAPERGEDGALAAVVCGNLFAFSVSLVPALPLESARAADVVLLVYLGAIQIALAYVFVARGLRGVTALEASVILLVEPLFNPLLTWLVHREEPHPLAMLGGVAILCATLLKAWWERGVPAPQRNSPSS
jgi:drug/metabolite transporter (DMT)-like permease